MTIQPAPTQCSRCNATPEVLQVCARCKTARYCSKSCQTEHWPSHKADCQPDHNYILHFQVFPAEITNPPVWRTLSVPANISFAKLHEALQVAFGWANTHSFEFTVNDPDFDPDRDALTLAQVMQRNAQMDSMGANWEKYRGDPTAPREYMLRILDDSNGAVRKIDRIHAPSRAHPRTKIKKASQTKLFQVLGKAEYKGEISRCPRLNQHLRSRADLRADKPFQYVYDLGDNWEHDFSIIGTAPVTDAITILNGGGHPIAEDSGSYPGWQAVLDAYRAERPTQEQREKMRWFAHKATNGDVRGLKGEKDQEWDTDNVARQLEALA